MPLPSASDPPPATLARFRDGLSRLVDPLPQQIGVAVSGGADSMALLLLAATALGERAVAATVDHGLRAGSTEEAAMVARFCADRDIAHVVLPAGEIAGASLQAQARTARYAALARWAADAGIGAILTAHHTDDQAETLLMRAARGSGLAGLAGIRARTTIAGCRVARPLLGWRREELRAIVIGASAPFVDDPANDDPRHDRTHARRLLAATPWLDAPALARSATCLGEAEDDLAALADWLWHARWDGASLDPADLPREALRRLVRRAVAQARDAAGITAPAFTESTNVEPLLDALAAGRSATQSGILATVADGRWHFRPAPARRH